ncbi:Anaerobic sulfatase-maturating enzyme [compost metagenome]
MTTEIKLLGNSCNLGCSYCYENPMRFAGNTRVSKGYDIDLVLSLADQNLQNKSGGYSVFGGEGTLVPIRDLERIFKEGFEKYGSSSIQTNGTLITDQHIELFKRYNVSVGVSTDGPNELNGLRTPLGGMTLEEATSRTNESIRRMIAAGVSVSVILTLHKENASPDRLPRLISFIKWLMQIGVRYGIVHLLEIDDLEAKKHELSEEENINAMISLSELFEENPESKFAPFCEIDEMMSHGNFKAGCVWKPCDPSNTPSVFGIEGNGQISNCGMVNKEGIEWTKSKDPSPFVRPQILYHTDQDKNGCKDCPFFIACNGYCTGSSIDGDFRNRTVHCGTIKKMMEFYENKAINSGFVPFSKRDDRKQLEEEYLNLAYEGSDLYDLSQLKKEEDK